MTETEQHSFQAEVKELLGLMVHSLYSNADIFLRELISNASDALDRLRFESLTKSELQTEEELAIRLDADRRERTLTISDNGIGMSRAELFQNLGTIAKSGTKEFLAAAKAAKSKGGLPPELIGQFGVGFYSSFIVADKVTVLTKKAGEDSATLWTSKGDGTFEIADASRPGHGTTITLTLKPVDEDNGVHDYTDEGVLRDIVKTHSDFVRYPIKMGLFVKDEQTGTQVLEDQTLNSMEALWAKPKGQVEKDEYIDFYRHIAHDWTEPLRHLVIKMEGTFEAQALLYIPASAPFDLYHPEMRRGVQLYVKRVFIMDECKELMPAYLRFVRGVVDAQDLPLNVSREILQRNRQLQLIRKQLVKKVLDELDDMKKSAPDDYRKFWGELGPVMKEGLASPENPDKNRLLDLLLMPSTHDADKPTTLEEYVGRMKPGQNEIYYLTAPSVGAARSSPHLERVTEQGYEVLFFTDNIDEIWLAQNAEYQGRTFCSVERGELEIGSAEERKKAEEAKKEKESALKGLLGRVRVHLQDEVKEVRLSGRLSTSAACLVSEPGDLTPQMERLLAQMGKEVPKTKRVLELNPDHAIVAGLSRLYETDPDGEQLKNISEVLYGQALLAEGGLPTDPARFSKLVGELVLSALDSAKGGDNVSGG